MVRSGRRHGGREGPYRPEPAALCDGVDFGWIDIPVKDISGEPVHRGGVTAVPGLYFLGLQWLSKMHSAFLSGVGDDAAVLADHISARG